MGRIICSRKVCSNPDPLICREFAHRIEENDIIKD